MIDLLYRIAFRCAYRLLRTYWALFHPAVHGAMVAVWHGGEILLVQSSYAPYRTLPGGFVRPGEPAREAARRELEEETGLRVTADTLRPVLDLRLTWEGKHDHAEVFELRLADRPAPRVDGREIVAAAFHAPPQALALSLSPIARRAIEEGSRRQADRG